MKILFAGSPDNAAGALEAIVSAGFEVVGVLTRPDSKKGKSSEFSPTEVAMVALGKGIPTRKTARLSEDDLQWIKDLDPDVGVVVAFGTIFPAQALNIPKSGWINLHYSLLPEFRGAAPVQHALLVGREETGVTIFQLDEGLDTGPILSRKSLAISPLDNAETLLLKLSLLGNDLLVHTLNSLPDMIANATEQNSSLASLAPKISRHEARIDFGKTASQVVNLIRAMYPEPVAWFEFEGKPIRVLRASISTDHELVIGQGVILEGKFIVGVSGGCVELIEIQPAGKNPMPGADWFRGLRREAVQLA